MDRLEFLNMQESAKFIEQHLEKISNFTDLSRFITKFIRDMMPERSVVLMIDEVDKNSGNQLFLTFLGMLRNKYLKRNKGQDFTFHSVILAGVHDIKTLKAIIRHDEERQFNSPWNIAVDFEVDLSFAPHEIETMLGGYSNEKGIRPDIPAIAERLFYYTSGYPFLVSKLCKFIDEKLFRKEMKKLVIADVEAAFKIIANEGYTTTLFDSLGKNLENNPELYDLIFKIVINGNNLSFSIIDPVVNLGHLYGIIVQSEEGHCRIHNRIFEQRIYGSRQS